MYYRVLQILEISIYLDTRESIVLEAGTWCWFGNVSRKGECREGGGLLLAARFPIPGLTDVVSQQSPWRGSEGISCCLSLIPYQPGRPLLSEHPGLGSISEAPPAPCKITNKTEDRRQLTANDGWECLNLGQTPALFSASRLQIRNPVSEICLNFLRGRELVYICWISAFPLGPDLASIKWWSHTHWIIFLNPALLVWLLGKWWGWGLQFHPSAWLRRQLSLT